MSALGGVNGTICTVEQYQQSQLSFNSKSPWISCLTRGETIGIVLMAEASFVSAISIIVIFTCIGWNIRWYMKKFPNDNWKLFQSPADIYMFSLFAFDILQATGGILNIWWIHKGIVTTGPYCTAQGIVEQIGELGVPLITLLLAIHTFVSAVLQVGLKARGVAFVLVCLACIFDVLWVAIGASIHKGYETPTPYWCWIGPRYVAERYAGETSWMWAALIASVILYIPLFFWAEGFWSIDEDRKFHWRNPDQRVDHAQRQAALGMLLYPLAYSLVILPLTIARCLEFGHHKVPLAATFFGVTVFYLSGAINVILFLVVRPKLLLFPRPDKLVDELDIQLIPQDPAPPAIVAEMIQCSPEPTSDTLGDPSEGSRDSRALSALSYVKPRGISEDAEDAEDDI